MTNHPSIKLSSNLLRSTFLSKPKPNQIKLTQPPIIRQSSSFIPGRTSSTNEEKHTIVPKPTSPNWFTTHPALSDSLSELDSLIKRSREKLYESSVLKRFSAPASFAGTGVRLKWLKYRMEQELKASSSINEEESKIFKTLWSSSTMWHDLEVISTILQGNEGRSLRMIEYSVTLNKLNEIKSLQKYLLFLKFSQLSKTPSLEIESLNQEINQVLLKFIKPDRIRKSIKNEEYGRDRLGRFYGIGKKKESTARAWMIEVQVPDSVPVKTSESTTTTSEIELDRISAITTPSSTPEPEPTQDLQHVPLGQIFCNGRSITEYFHTPRQRATALRALEITDSLGHYHIHLLTHGGGKMGQAAAVSHALANALMNALQESAKTDSTAQERYARKVLSKSQLTLRDPRVVERKKTGKPGAKSSYRWVKR